MVKPSKWGWPLLAILSVIAAISVPYVYWYNKPAKTLQAVILDKTVPVSNYREHKGLVWILNNLKLTKNSEGSIFDYSKDYFGFFPLDKKSYDIKDLPGNMGKPDLIYLADAYGVYTDDFYTDNKRGARSELLYGGLTQEDVTKVTKALGPKTVLVAEFNTLALPTSSQVRQQMEKILGLKWQEWTGRYFTDLASQNTEVPSWLIRNYESQYKTTWKFKGPGFAYVCSDDRIFILRVGQEVSSKALTIQFTPGAGKEFGIEGAVPFYYWFDVVQAQPGTEILANYELDVTPQGQKILEEYRLPATFPAVLRNNSQGQTYYFAGDFADNSQVPTGWNNAATPFIKKWLVTDIKGSQNKFFWNVYYRLIEKIAGGAAHAQ